MSSENAASTVIQSLGGGSGIDFLKLARDLTDAEKAPQEARLTQAKERSEAKISAIAVLQYNVDLFTESLNGLNDVSELAVPKVSSADSSAVSVGTAQGAALAGSYDITVSALAEPQRNVSVANDVAKGASINGGNAFTITLSGDNGENISIDILAGRDSLEEIAAAINASGGSYQASAVATDVDGASVKLILQGATGSSSGFSVSASSDNDQGAVSFFNGTNTNKVQSATNASFNINGVDISRESNEIDDVVDGVAFSLESVASTTLKVVSDHSTLKAKLQGLVQSYNDIQVAAAELADPDSEEEIVGGALSRDKALIRSVRDALYDAVTATSSTTSGNVAALRDIGISLTKTGDLSFDEDVFDQVATSSFDDIATMLSAGTDDQSEYDPRPKGWAFDAIQRLDILSDEREGLFVSQSENEAVKLINYEADLLELDAKMENIYQRYVKQFSIMESLVSSINSTRDSMTTTWENMSKSYFND